MVSALRRVVLGLPGLRLDLAASMIAVFWASVSASNLAGLMPSTHASAMWLVIETIALHLEELGANRHVDRVLLAVDDLELQRVVDFREGHRRRRGAQLAEELDPQRIVGHAQLQAGEVLRLVDRQLGIGDLAERPRPEVEALDADLVEIGDQFLAELALPDRRATALSSSNR